MIRPAPSQGSEPGPAGRHGPSAPRRHARQTGRRLVVGLGNPLAGDDAIGRRLAARLAGDPRLPTDVDVAIGSDLLRLQDRIRDRAGVLVIDAVLDEQDPGTLSLLTEAEAGADGPGTAHLFSPVTALRLLRATDPALGAVPVRFALVSIDAARIRDGLSARLNGRLDDLAARVLDLLE